MSKRDKGASLMTYAEEGYVPAALVNYLCLLGWSPKNNRESWRRPKWGGVDQRKFCGTTRGST